MKKLFQLPSYLKKGGQQIAFIKGKQKTSKEARARKDVSVSAFFWVLDTTCLHLPAFRGLCTGHLRPLRLYAV